MRIIKIFICKIISACKTNLSIDHRDLSVVTVIQKHIQSRHKWIKHSAMNSCKFQFFHKIRINKSYRSHIIIENTDFHSCLYTFFQNILYFLPCLVIFYGMIFHKNKLFCFRQIFKLCIKPFFCCIIIGNICILIYRVMCISLNISTDISGFWNFSIHLFQACHIVRKQRQ